MQHHRIRALFGRMAADLLVAGILFASYPGVGAALQSLALRTQVETGQAGDLARAPNELVFRWGAGDNAPARLVMDIVVDEGFVAQVGIGWENHVSQMLDETNEVLAQVGLSLEPGSIQLWRSNDSATTLAALLDSEEAQTSKVPGRALLAITAHDTATYDGWNHAARGSAILRHYQEDRGRNAIVIAHELGHILGATHHEKDEECHDEGCIMVRRGFAHAGSWCEHHERVIRHLIASRMESWDI